jgi:hypothetical protein
MEEKLYLSLKDMLKGVDVCFNLSRSGTVRLPMGTLEGVVNTSFGKAIVDARKLVEEYEKNAT